MSFVKILILISSLLSFAACGDAEGLEEVKDYSLTVGSSNSDVHHAIYSLIARFAAESGVNSIRYERNLHRANSHVSLIEGLQLRTGHVGYGNWNVSVRGNVMIHSMQLEFDGDYFTELMNSDSSFDRDELFKLFAHEVGHGLQFRHEPDPEDLMFFDISGYKDFEPFYQRVRGYLGR